MLSTLAFWCKRALSAFYLDQPTRITDITFYALKMIIILRVKRKTDISLVIANAQKPKFSFQIQSVETVVQFSSTLTDPVRI